MRREGNCCGSAQGWCQNLARCCNNDLTPVKAALLHQRSLARRAAQTYIDRALAREHGPRHEAVEHFALPLRKGVRAFSEEHELVLLGVVDGLAGVAEIGGDRGAVVAMLAWPCAVRVHCYPPHSPSSSANIELIS